MKAPTFRPLLIVGFLFALCNQAWAFDQETAESMYQPEKAIEIQVAELDFWTKKFDQRPGEYLYAFQMAVAHDALFDLTANIEHLKKAESLYLQVIQNQPLDPAPVMRSLARNYISQHRFCDALSITEKALEAGSGKRSSELILCDLYGELGHETAQRNMLIKLSDKRDFAYLIRLAKWEDVRGRLPEAIQLLEAARDLAEASGNSKLKQWIYSNLGDFYGHAGNIEASERHFRMALEENPADWYSMKGLAWIAYSHGLNTDKALAIINAVKTHSKDPGLYLLRAEILEYRGELERSEAIVEKMAAHLSQAVYGRMYSSFLCEVHINKGNTQQALELALAEITERPVPMAYDMLASVLVAQNQYTKAQTISKLHIWNRTFEPGILKNQLRYFDGLWHPYLGQIQSEIQEAQYELGPLVSKSLQPRELSMI